MKKQHKHAPTPFDAAPASTLFDMEYLSHWMTEYGKWILLTLAALFIALFLYILSFTESYQSEADYFKAANAFETFSNATSTPENKETALTTLKSILSKRPELHAAYDGLIAQTLISRGQYQEARPFATLALSRTKK